MSVAREVVDSVVWKHNLTEGYFVKISNDHLNGSLSSSSSVTDRQKAFGFNPF